MPAGHVYRLPTEAEWEYACRAGTTTRFSFGDDLDYNLLRGFGWFSANASGQSHAVGEKSPNRWGVFDMHGNVWEWCGDWYSGSYQGGSATEPKGASTGSRRVIRGGSWGDGGHYCQSARRYGDSPSDRSSDLGFRVVLAPGQ